MFFNRETRQIALFNKTSGDLITAEKFRQGYFNKCVDSSQIGKAKKLYIRLICQILITTTNNVIFNF